MRKRVWEILLERRGNRTENKECHQNEYFSFEGIAIKRIRSSSIISTTCVVPSIMQLYEEDKVSSSPEHDPCQISIMNLLAVFWLIWAESSTRWTNNISEEQRGEGGENPQPAKALKCRFPVFWWGNTKARKRERLQLQFSISSKRE